MGYQIRVVPEVEAWLERLREHDADVAGLVDEAVAALRLAGESLGAPVVVPVDRLAAGRAREDLDATYERQLEMLTFVRRATADVATSRKRVELQLQQLENNAASLDENDGRRAELGRRLATLRSQYAELRDEETHMTVAGRRLQGRVDDFRARKELLNATWATEAAVAEATSAEAVIDDALAQLASSAPAPPQSQATSRGGATPVPLSELLPGAPDRTDIHILFTVEEPGTAVLLAAGTHDDVLQAWYARAIAEGSMRYRRDSAR